MSGNTLSAAASLEPVTVEEARSQCRITDSTEDGLIAGYLLAARELAERWTGRAFATQTRIETFDNDWPRPDGHDRRLGRYSKRQIMLQRPTLQTVSAIQYFDTNGAQQTLDPTQYRVGRRQLIGVIDEAYGACWPAVRRQIDTISVTYNTGYASPGQLPETARQAILLLVGHFYRNREATAEASARVTVQELPIGVQALLASHVVPWVF